MNECPECGSEDLDTELYQDGDHRYCHSCGNLWVVPWEDLDE